MSDMTAHSISSGDRCRLMVHSVGSPLGRKDPRRCGTLPEYTAGSVCYRVCGEIPRGRKPAGAAFFRRTAHQDGAAPWVPCDGDGCQGGEFVFDAEASQACGVFKLWRGDGSHQDLMIEVHLA